MNLLKITLLLIAILIALTTIPQAKTEMLTVHGNSMEPTIHNNQQVYLDRNYYTTHTIRQEDIVAVKFSTRPELFVKRIVALPGDNVQITQDTLTNKKNKKTYVLPYITATNPLYLQLQNANFTIPSGSYLVLGDNSKISFDSTSYGLISRDLIIGKIKLNI